jgi:hypothetical protein
MSLDRMNLPTNIELPKQGVAPTSGLQRFIPGRFRREPALSAFRIEIWALVIIPVLLLFSALFMDEGNAKILWSALAAAIACLVALAAVGYKLASFVSITAIYHLIIYPLAAWGNLLLAEPAVRGDLWVDTYLAMQGCAVGILGMALGVLLANYSMGPQKVSAYGRGFKAPTATGFNILLTLLIIPVALLLAKLGMYYHQAIVGNITEGAGEWLNLIAIMQYIAYSGVFLQVYRYTRTHSRKDAYVAGGLCVMCILVFLPSGARYSSFAFLPLLLLAFSVWEADYRKRIAFMASSILVILVFTVGIGTYRSMKGIEQEELEDKYKLVFSSTLNPRAGGTDPLALIIGRFSDYVAAGRIIAFTPEAIDFRGAESLEDLWQIYVPGFLNILPNRINLADAAEISDRYWITMHYKGGGSSPCMIIGDLFSRWGWPGIFLGMLAIGFALRQFDLRIFFQWNAFTIIYFVLMARLILSISGGSLVQLCVTLFRDSLVLALIAYVLSQVVKGKRAGYGGKVE